MGKRLVNLKREIDATKTYDASEAVAMAKKTANTNFVGNVEAHVKLGIDPKKSEQTVRATVTLPAGSGKPVRIVAFVTEAKEKEAQEAGAVVFGGDELIKKIKETQKTDFDLSIAEPAMMAKLAQIAKILGPKGLMPNPKTGTVTADIGKTIKEYSTGKTEFKNDESGNVHMILGKTNFEDSKILANLKAFMEALRASKPAGLKKEFIQSVILHSTMGPAIKLKI